MTETPFSVKSAAPKFVGELWTSSQRQASAIHEISYRACFKPQVPQYFIRRFSSPGDVVYDPFMGRGTTVLEAILESRRAIGNDVNPLSVILVEPRLAVPDLSSVIERTESIRVDTRLKSDIDLSMFYHKRTLTELLSVRQYLHRRKQSGEEDAVDRWIRMIATNRLTGHSPGFFSVYTLPPNQATSAHHQRRINRERSQRPPYRNVMELVVRKTQRLLRALGTLERERLAEGADRVMMLTSDARKTAKIEKESVQLTITSPPFLDIVDYASDNWLRCWFNRIDTNSVATQITRCRTVMEWENVMAEVFEELFRVTKKGGYVAFEVGEIRKRTIQLEQHVIPLGLQSGFSLKAVFINQQRFTKTSNIWGVRNNVGGTNTNRIVLFEKR